MLINTEIIVILVRVGYKIIPAQVDIFIEDEGGRINSNFIPFVLRHRELSHVGRISNFYEFSGLERPKESEGKGTSFMHLYASEVHYYKAQSGGLLVHIIKRK